MVDRWIDLCGDRQDFNDWARSFKANMVAEALRQLRPDFPAEAVEVE